MASTTVSRHARRARHANPRRHRGPEFLDLILLILAAAAGFGLTVVLALGDLWN